MITIRLANPNDVSLITDMGRSSFIQAFAHLNDPVHFQAHLDRYHTYETIEDEFKIQKNQFYIAEYFTKPAGFCKLVLDEDEKHPELANYSCLELERIYVLKPYQGLHIGYHLFNKAEEVGCQTKFEILWLGVWEKNLKAIEIYKKWGFSEFGSHTFDLGGDIQTDLMMKKYLTL